MAGNDASQQRAARRDVDDLLGERWRLHKAGCGRHRQAVCELWSHELGWELRLIVDGSDVRDSHVAQASAEIPTVIEQWKAVMVGRGWS